MRWLLVGVLLGLLVVFPSLLTLLVTVVAAGVSQPLVVAFAAGVLARPHLPGMRRWAQ